MTYFNYFNTYTAIVEKFPSNSHFVEVGAWTGDSSIYMAKEIKRYNKNIKFDVIDIWELGEWSDSDHFNFKDNLYDRFLYNIKENDVENIINPIKMFSEEASKLYKNESLDFVFLDASHKYQDIRKDIICWLPKVKPTGILAGHDYNWEEVKRAVDELIPTKTDNICWFHCKYQYE